MKRVVAATVKRDSKVYYKKLSEAQGYIEKAISCFEIARENAYNGDSTGKILSMQHDAERLRKVLSQERSKTPVNPW